MVRLRCDQANVSYKRCHKLNIMMCAKSLYHALNDSLINCKLGSSLQRWWQQRCWPGCLARPPQLPCSPSGSLSAHLVQAQMAHLSLLLPEHNKHDFFSFFCQLRRLLDHLRHVLTAQLAGPSDLRLICLCKHLTTRHDSRLRYVLGDQTAVSLAERAHSSLIPPGCNA